MDQEPVNADQGFEMDWKPVGRYYRSLSDTKAAKTNLFTDRSILEESKERIVAHLANFAYDPYNYTFLRQLNILELFLDCITEPNEKLVEFRAGGICNSCVDPANAATITKCGGISLIILFLSSPVRNTVFQVIY